MTFDNSSKTKMSCGQKILWRQLILVFMTNCFQEISEKKHCFFITVCIVINRISNYTNMFIIFAIFTYDLQNLPASTFRTLTGQEPDTVNPKPERHLRISNYE